MKTDKNIILNTAKLASLEISEKEIGKYLKEFTSILEYVDKLKKVNTEKVKPTSYIQDIATPQRKDETGETLKREEALKNNPEEDKIFFKVPKFIE